MCQGFSVFLSSGSCRGIRAPFGAQGKGREVLATPRRGVASTSLPLRAGFRPASMTNTEKPG
ncbi:MAG TPA: hypothetical protein VKY19_10995 [Ktedonosporobacter sp.]|nr:hypothetical protein [Ktedonosporobacter sp.]